VFRARRRHRATASEGTPGRARATRAAGLPVGVQGCRGPIPVDHRLDVFPPRKGSSSGQRDSGGQRRFPCWVVLKARDHAVPHAQHLDQPASSPKAGWRRCARTWSPRGSHATTSTSGSLPFHERMSATTVPQGSVPSLHGFHRVHGCIVAVTRRDAHPDDSEQDGITMMPVVVDDGTRVMPSWRHGSGTVRGEHP
jgi:hypothetical protein